MLPYSIPARSGNTRTTPRYISLLDNGWDVRRWNRLLVCGGMVNVVSRNIYREGIHKLAVRDFAYAGRHMFGNGTMNSLGVGSGRLTRCTTLFFGAFDSYLPQPPKHNILRTAHPWNE